MTITSILTPGLWAFTTQQAGPETSAGHHHHPLKRTPWQLATTALAALALMGGCATAPSPTAAVGGPAAGTAALAGLLGTGNAGPSSVEPVTSGTARTAPALAKTSTATGAASSNASTDVAVIAVDALQPSVPLDLDAANAKTDLWARVRVGLAVPDLNNDLVRKWEQWYAARPEYVQRMTERGGRYLFHIVEELNKRGLPTELALLPFIESGFNPQAMSTAKASGMWQFVPATGRDFSLRQNVFRDDRRDVLASTRAALDYLQTLNGMFGDWQLALAAYNWGQGSVQRAIKRNQAAGLPTDYASLSMPDETRNYYPKLQAVKNIVLRAEAFSLTLPKLNNHPYFVSVGISRDIDVEVAARLAGLPLEAFKQLNPQMNKPVILAAGTPQVLLPYDSANRFVHAVTQQKGNLASWTAWVAPKTMKPAAVALQVGMAEPQLRAVNNIPKGMLVKVGSTLLVPRNAQRVTDVTEQVADHAMLALAPDLPPMRKLSFKIGKHGDSVVAVAKRYRVSAQQVAALNGTSAAGRFKPGQSVVVMVPVRSGKASATRLAGRPGTGGGVQLASAAGGSRKAGGGKRGRHTNGRVRVAQG